MAFVSRRLVELLEDGCDDPGRSLVVAALDQTNELLTPRVFEQLRGRVRLVEANGTPPIEIAQRRRAALLFPAMVRKQLEDHGVALPPDRRILGETAIEAYGWAST